MSSAKNGDTVSVDYTGRVGSGEVFDSSEGREPIQFTIGGGEVIPGFEHAVEGMEEGESKTITITARDGYGERDNNLLITVDRSQLPLGMEPQVGSILRVQTEDGIDIPVTVVSISSDSITLDANHPLAGKDLTFDLKLVKIYTPETVI